MNNNKNLATVCSWYPGKRPASSLVAGVVFTFKGETATFVRWNGPAYRGRDAMLRGAVVSTPNSPNRVWYLNMAGSVGIV